MKQREKIVKDNPILEGIDLDAYIGVVNGKPVLCEYTKCDTCDLDKTGNCGTAISEWLDSEVEKYE